ncbi:MAG TPA: hypothetical protein VEK08_02105 [Planctomycetota bacterium]|nr:hypothetical protein [Planctomycetota bacterium]
MLRAMCAFVCLCAALATHAGTSDATDAPRNAPAEIRLIDREGRVLLSRDGVPLAAVQLRAAGTSATPAGVLTFDQARRALAGAAPEQLLQSGAEQIRELQFPLAGNQAGRLNVLLRAKKTSAGARLLVSSTVLSETAPPELGSYELAVQIFSADGKIPDILHIDGVRELPKFDSPFTRRARTWSLEKKDFRVVLARSAPATWNVHPAGGDVILTQRLLPDSRNAAELGTFVAYVGTSVDEGLPELSPLKLDKVETPARDFVEGRVRVYSSGSNPFVLAETAVVAEVACPPAPNGEVPIKRLPCFFWEAPSRAPAESEFRFRFAPPAEGIYGVRIVVVTPAGQARGEALSFRAGPPANPGVVKIRSDERFFRLDDGRPWIPVGGDLSAVGPAGGKVDGLAGAFRTQFTRLIRGGGNAARITLSLNGLQLEKNAAQFDADAAAELDEILRAAQARDVRVILCAERAEDISKNSALHPYFRERGGPLAATPEFFRNVTAKRYFQNRVTYLAARYGAFRSVWSWELLESVDTCWPILKQDPDTAKLKINEVDLARRARRDVQEWIEEMALYLRGMDSHEHPICVSLTLNPETPWLDLERSENLDWIFTRTEIPRPDAKMAPREIPALLSEWSRTSRLANRRVRPYAILGLSPFAQDNASEAALASLASGFAAPVFASVDPAGTQPLSELSAANLFALAAAALLDLDGKECRLVDDESAQLRVRGYVSQRGAAVWVRVPASETVPKATELRLPGVHGGNYGVSWLDAASGRIIAHSQHVAAAVKAGQAPAPLSLKIPGSVRDAIVLILPMK